MRRRFSDKRQKSDIYYFRYWGYLSDGSGHYDVSDPVGSVLSYGTFKEIFDVPTPGYYKMLRESRDISNPCSYTSTVVEYKPTQIYWAVQRSVSGGRTQFGFGSGSGFLHSFISFPKPVIPDWLKNDVSRAPDYLLIEAASKANSANFSGITFAAEALKTVSMLRHPLKGITSLLGKMSSHREKLLRSGVSLSKASASTWLEYRYGWKPLLMDVSDLSKSLMSLDRLPGRVLRDSVRRDFPYQTVLQHSGIPIGDLRVYGDTSLSYRCTVRAGVRYNIVDPSYGQFLDTGLGLTLDNVPSAIWEEVPFSFIADWFVNFGPWLRAIVPNPYIEYLSNFISVHTEEVYVTSVTRTTIDATAWSAGTFIPCGSGGGASSKTISGFRNVNMKISRTPMIVPGRLSLTHSIDALSLSLQACLRNCKSFKH